MIGNYIDKADNDPVGNINVLYRDDNPAGFTGAIGFAAFGAGDGV